MTSSGRRRAASTRLLEANLVLSAAFSDEVGLTTRKLILSRRLEVARQYVSGMIRDKDSCRSVQSTVSHRSNGVQGLAGGRRRGLHLGPEMDAPSACPAVAARYAAHIAAGSART